MKVSKKVKNSILLVIGFFIVWGLFLGIVGNRVALNWLKEPVDPETGGFLPGMAYLFVAFAYCIITSVFSGICYYSKKIDKTYKSVICFFPFITLIFTLPMLNLVLDVQIFIKQIIEYVKSSL